MLFDKVLLKKLMLIHLLDHYWNTKRTSGHGCQQFVVMLISDMMYFC